MSYAGVSKEDKHSQEKAAMERLEAQLGAAHGMVGNELRELWCEYEEGKTKEASLVKQLDKLEMLLQAAEYEKGTLMLHFKVSCRGADGRTQITRLT